MKIGKRALQLIWFAWSLILMSTQAYAVSTQLKISFKIPNPFGNMKAVIEKVKGLEVSAVEKDANGNALISYKNGTKIALKLPGVFSDGYNKEIPDLITAVHTAVVNLKGDSNNKAQMFSQVVSALNKSGLTIKDESINIEILESVVNDYLQVVSNEYEIYEAVISAKAEIDAALASIEAMINEIMSSIDSAYRVNSYTRYNTDGSRYSYITIWSNGSTSTTHEVNETNDRSGDGYITNTDGKEKDVLDKDIDNDGVSNDNDDDDDGDTIPDSEDNDDDGDGKDDDEDSDDDNPYKNITAETEGGLPIREDMLEYLSQYLNVESLDSMINEFIKGTMTNDEFVNSMNDIMQRAVGNTLYQIIDTGLKAKGYDTKALNLKANMRIKSTVQGAMR